MPNASRFDPKAIRPMVKRLRSWSPLLCSASEDERVQLSEILVQLESAAASFDPLTSGGTDSGELDNGGKVKWQLLAPAELLNGLRFAKVLRRASNIHLAVDRCIDACFAPRLAQAIRQSAHFKVPSTTAMQRAQVQVDGAFMLWLRDLPAFKTMRPKYMSDSSPQGGVNWSLTQFTYLEFPCGHTPAQLLGAIWNLSSLQHPESDDGSSDCDTNAVTISDQRRAWGAALLACMKIHIQVLSDPQTQPTSANT